MPVDFISAGIFYIDFSLITRGQRNKTKANGDGSAEVVSLGGESRVESSWPGPGWQHLAQSWRLRQEVLGITCRIPLMMAENYVHKK